MDGHCAYDGGFIRAEHNDLGRRMVVRAKNVLHQIYTEVGFPRNRGMSTARRSALLESAHWPSCRPAGVSTMVTESEKRCRLARAVRKFQRPSIVRVANLANDDGMLQSPVSTA
jgi:hypothetical protein